MILNNRKKKRKMKQGTNLNVQSIGNIKLEICNNWKTSKRDHVVIEINLVENSCYRKNVEVKKKNFLRRISSFRRIDDKVEALSSIEDASKNIFLLEH
jgi:hypothetical protein